MTETPALSSHTSEHLANERTYLAWVRTAISIMTLGIAVNKLSLALVQADRLDPAKGGALDAETLGVGMVVLGMALLLGGAVRFQQVARHIDRASYRPLRFKAWLIAGSILIAGVVVLLWLEHHA